ncbi:hypothetical protein MNBD_GAMMA18-1219, partial [hydrothermal vent metagenome]
MASKITVQRGGKEGRVKAWCCTAFCAALMFNTISLAVAGPDGGQVVGGAGSITHSDNTTTTINQATQNMAIDWQNYNINVDERVQYIQPNSSSISLNRILSQSGSTIAGRIDANGQVILVNPNGIFFTPTSIINVGGIIASGLNIQPNDFMNGNYIFDEVLGTDGTVINSGMINASLGGNVALIGKQVKNDGLIVANLGSVTLAAGKQAVLTFDQGGLLGVRVSKEILQEELGVDPGVINSGNIQAVGGRVLLTASTSQDIFSQAVNSGGLNQATSVVVHEDGSFTLGGGADVINTGSIDTSTALSDQNAGRIVLIGENVTSSGELFADATDGRGGEIELHAKNTTLLTENSVTSARSETNGQGGLVKILGDRVGVFDQSTVDVTGADGGGQVLIGGDYQGNNVNIRNARFTQVSQGARLFADALVVGDGGTIISWGNEYTWFYGTATAQGGRQRGDGGLVEISGKGLAFDGTVDTRAINGTAGRLLFDPLDIIIFDGADAQDNDSNLPSIDGDAGGNVTFNISEGALESLSATTDIFLQANRNITINDLADNVLDLKTEVGSSVIFRADATGNGTGNFVMNDASDTIQTQGGEVLIRSASVTVGNIDTTGAVDSNGGNITVRADNGSLSVGALTSSGGVATAGNAGNNAGNIELRTGDTDSANDRITINGNIIADGSDADGANTGGDAGSITLRAGNAAGGEDRITFNGDRMISAQGGNSTNASDVGLHNAIDIDTPLLVTTGAVTLTTERTRSYSGPAQGEITLAFDDDGTPRVAQVTLGGDLTVATGYSSNVNFTTAIDYNGISVGTLTLNADNDVVVVGAMSDSDTDTADLLNISLNANTDGGSNGDVIINGIQSTDVSINTGGGVYTVTGVNYDGESTASSKRTVDTGTAGDANINMTGYALLGEMVVGGTLNITAGDTNASNSISQGTRNPSSDTLTVMGASSFISTALAGNIDLTNNNNLQGAITLTTDNGGANNVTLNNTATTTLDVVDTGGNLTVNADQDLTLTRDITVGGAAQLNFARDNNDRTFTAGSGLTTYSVTGSSFITGGNGNDTFDLSASISGPIDGGAGNDIFNINAPGLTLTNLRGGAGNDTLNGNDSANTWQITTDDGGTLNSTTTFSQMETLTGGSAVDSFTVDSGSSIDTLNGQAGDDQFTINGTVTTLNGNAGTDSITVSATSGTDYGEVAELSGGADGDTITLDTNARVTGAITGNGGGDVITVNGTAGTVNTGTGDDILSITAASSVTGLIDGGTGADSLTITGSDATIALATDVDQIETLAAMGGGINTLIGTNADTTWTVSAIPSLNDGSNTLTFSGFDNLTGGTGVDQFTISVDASTLNGGGGNDTFNINAPGVTLTNLRGGTGNDTLNGNDSANTWTINAANSGSLVNGGQTVTFLEMENLNGAANNDDTFRFTVTPTVGNVAIDGLGQTGQDNVNLAGLSGAVSVQLGATGFNNIESITGNNSNSTLIGTNADNTWNITAENDGNVGSLTFIDFNNLTGGTANDIFIFQTGGSLSGQLDGGIGSDRVDMSILATVDITLGQELVAIEQITGNNTDSILRGTTTANTFILTGANTGRLDDGLTFIDFNALDGGGGNDTFTFEAMGNLSGQLDGGTGTDSVDLSALATVDVTLGQGLVAIERLTGNNT